MSLCDCQTFPDTFSHRPGHRHERQFQGPRSMSVTLDQHGKEVLSLK